MPNIQKLIGKTIAKSSKKISSEQIKRFENALMSESKENPSCSALSSLGDFNSVFKALDIERKDALHARENFRLFEYPLIDQEFVVETRINDLFEQQAGDRPMGFIDVEIKGLMDDKPLFCLSRVYAISGGFKRS